MHRKRSSIRAIKKRLLELLKFPAFKPEQLKPLRIASQQVINALFSFLYNEDPVIKWNAVVAMGAVVSDIAGKDLEAARVIMRRLMWNLNDESGGIGWGSPEAMGEILAIQNTLALEYSSILFSYAREDGNFQEHPLMQRGVLWGIGRLCRSRPGLIREDTSPYIIPYLDSKDATVRGLAAKVLGLLGAKQTLSSLERLKGDENHLDFYEDYQFRECRVKDLAEEALKKLTMGG